MFKFFRKRNKKDHSECSREHVLPNKQYDMIGVREKRGIEEIADLLPQLESDDGSVGFYVVSVCCHQHRHNNRILLWAESQNRVIIEVQRPQDLCLCSSFYKTVSYDEFVPALKDMEQVINYPEEAGFVFEEWG